MITPPPETPKTPDNKPSHTPQASAPSPPPLPGAGAGAGAGAGDGGSKNVITLIKEIKAGVLPGKQLAPEDRQACVLHLGVEGLSVPEIAEFLGVHERTIKRDRRTIRDANTLEHDPAMAGQMAGQLVHEAETAIARIRRAVRDKDTPVAVKVEAERHCFNICNDMIGRLQSLGFLPSATQQIRADLTHHIGDMSSLTEIRREVDRLEVLEQAQALPTPTDGSASSTNMISPTNKETQP